MKSFKTVLISIIASITLLLSCSTSKDLSKSNASCTKNENGLLWQITKKGSMDTSYLFGTIHLIPSKDYFYPSGTVEAIQRVDQVYFEVDMDELDDMSKMGDILGKIVMPNETVLSDLITVDELKIVKAYFDKNELPYAFFERFKPLITSTLVSGQLNNENFAEHWTSYEMEFWKIAKNAGKAINGLETLDFQISLFDQIPYKAQAKILVRAIKDLSSGREMDDEFAQMLKAYKLEDLNKLETIITNSSKKDTDGDFEKILINNRNKAWVPIISTECNKNPCFFAVGAGHLPGKFGLINLLKENGFTVVSVKSR